MGFWEAIADLAESVAPWSVAEAEAPAEDSKAEDTPAEDSKDESTEEEGSAEEEPEEEEDEEEEEEEEEEPKDPKDELEEACKESKQCAPAKHHYDECVERVTSQQENGGAKEDCVEEFFHLAHCATQCAAPKLWSVLK
ncbi:Cytochrome b-c1 complex subunit 6 [Cytospora mali]|uniref:Cytochrome b-c1 complex subunit 6, mitochondrial n=1 Tax=Cytospora mali TaxID=578113 RepID=A0A194UML2_CYTMA|nr:Cytochrome b-c1 complex subunit 6 [Valsa mali var. pyri (nom. inval.)]